MTMSSQSDTTKAGRAEPPAHCGQPPARRVIVFIVVLVHATVLLRAGYDLQGVLVHVGSLGLLAAVVAHWVSAPIPVRAWPRPANGGLA
jgi:hypothetical protein